jgi:hypothetical protein
MFVALNRQICQHKGADMVRTIRIETWFLVVALPLLSTTVAQAAQVVVFGRSNAAADVAAVQTAVNRGGVIYLQGAFSFDHAPVDGRTILITTAVTILGRLDAKGNMPSISGGTIPFRIMAPGATVTLEGLRFIGPTAAAIEVASAGGLRIANSRIERVGSAPLPAMPVSGAFGIAFSGGAVSGTVAIERNTIDIGGTSAERTSGITTAPQGFEPGVRIRIVQNVITNTTAHGIDLRNVAGSANIESNVVIAGRIGSQPEALADNFVDGIRCLGSGEYRVALNWIDVGYENAAGIRLQGNAAAMPITGALVTGNYVRMFAASDALGGSENAGIELRRATVRAVVQDNLIHGLGKAALSVASETGRVSVAATLWLDARWFSPGPTRPDIARGADVFVGPGSMDTHVTGGPGTFSVDDQGIRTIVEHWN